jgi:hypothetical protein
MPDTVRDDATILALLADNTAGDISAQDVRDAYVTLRGLGALATTAAKTSAHAAAPGERVLTDSSGGPFTVTAPAAPGHGWCFALHDGTDSWPDNPVTVDGNGATVEGAATYACEGGRDLAFVYDAATTDWRIAEPFVPGTLVARADFDALRAGGGLIATPVKTSAYTAAAGDLVLTNTSGGPLTVTLDTDPSHGDHVALHDTSDSWSTNNVTVARNGKTIEGAAADLLLDGGRRVDLIFNATTDDWEVSVTFSTADLSSKQDADADLTALAALSGTGLAARTGAGAWTTRTITAGSAKVAVTNGGGVAGDPTVDLGAVASTDLSDGASLYKSGGTDVAVADGGTGAGTVETARNNLGLTGTELTYLDKTGDFTLALTDAYDSTNGRKPWLNLNHATAITMTVPPNSSVAFPVGTVILFSRFGAGTATIAAGGGVTVNKPSDRALTLRAQYSQGMLRKTATDTWTLGGDLT